MIRNPILRGFNPDPSIVRVGDDYFIATSTFEWYPGIQIHHSRDLVHWKLVSRPLQRGSQLDLRGVPDSCGVWAPCLTYSDGLFYLTYSVVLRYGRTTVSGANGLALRDFHNYVVTAASIEGDWSDPVHLNSSGFDPSFFHDDDGRSYYLNLLWDHRPDRKHFGGIIIQEYSHKTKRLVGERQMIFSGTELGFTEGPHLVKRNGWYYLIVAEGGTGWNHAVSIARSRQIYGPYEVSPSGPLLSSRDRPDWPLQRAGHGDLVEARDGSWLIVYLCGRPLPNHRRCVMGRETAIQTVHWNRDGWLETAQRSRLPNLNVESPEPENGVPDPDHIRYDFNTSELPADLQWLRTPEPDKIFSLTERPGHLRLYGRETLGSQYEQALVARRQQAFCFAATTLIDFSPVNFQQTAGLICYYNSTKYHYLYITHDTDAGLHLRVVSALPDNPEGYVFSNTYPIESGLLELSLKVEYEHLRFAFRHAEGIEWTWLDEYFDMSALSDESGPQGNPNFTGTFVGMACQDMSGGGLAADFDWFTYSEVSEA